MALMDRFREAWEDLRGTRKEEQETGQSVSESASQPVRGARAATPTETVEPAIMTLPETAFSQNSRDYASLVDRFSPSQDIRAQIPDQLRSAPDWPDDFPQRRLSAVEIARIDEQVMRVGAVIGVKHDQEFDFEREKGDIYTYKHSPTSNRIHVDSRGDFYDVQEGKEPALTTRAEVLRSYQEPSPEVLATLTPEHREQWTRLEKEVGFKGADNFNFYEQRGDVNIYGTNTDDRKAFIGLDSKGQFYDPSTEVPTPITRERALESVDIKQHFYTPENVHLREAVGNENAPDVTPYGRKNGDIQSYVYEPTGSTIHHDSEGRFYNLDRQVISREEAVSVMQALVGNERANMAPEPRSFDYGSSKQEGVPHLPPPSDLAVDSVKIPAPVQEHALSF